jgi:hypothetical protein
MIHGQPNLAMCQATKQPSEAEHVRHPIIWIIDGGIAKQLGGELVQEATMLTRPSRFAPAHRPKQAKSGRLIFMRGKKPDQCDTAVVCVHQRGKWESYKYERLQLIRSSHPQALCKNDWS